MTLLSSEKTLENIRSEYGLGELSVEQTADDPFVQFNAWMDDALKAELPEPTAMNLCTVDAEGTPYSRIMLLKGVDHGFLFYTNYQSAKGVQISANPKACINIFWQGLERQVRVGGTLEKVSREESVSYFKTRPVESQIGALASMQSQKITSRQVLEDAVARLKDQTHFDCPDNWGGYRLIPAYFEFWQGRPSRLNDRVYYEPSESGWQRYRLAP